MQEALRRPEGTMTFKYHSAELFDKDKRGGLLLQIPAGGHLFRLERDDNMLLHFYHSSPGTGTRVATIDLNSVPRSDRVFIGFTWSTSEINLYLRTREPDGKLVYARGIPSQKQFRIGKDGSIYQVRDQGVEVMGAQVYQNGKPVLQPTAIDAWNETIKAIDIVLTGKSEEGFMFEVAITNLILVLLVTGFESYAKKRFLEIEQEGITPNIDALINSIFSRRERDADIGTRLATEANEGHVSILELIIGKGSINFQDYEKCKLVYNKTYQIKFGEIELESLVLDRIQKYIKFRHRIIHVNALEAILNVSEVPLEEPIFSNRKLAGTAIKDFNTLISKLHEATLNLRRQD